MVGLILAMASLNGPPTAGQLEAWGRETVEEIRRDYLMPNRGGYYAETWQAGKPPEKIAFNWSCGVWLSALNAAAKVDSKYTAWLREYADVSRSYWHTAGPVPGYNELPGKETPDRYYDDNEWIVMALADTSVQLKNRKYRVWAEDALRYALSGEDAQLGGGLYWREKEKTSKNTCSNGPGAASCLAIYRLTNDKVLLAKAEELYAWTKKTLQDPADQLFWDNINLKGKIERMKWSYNTALMIRSACELYSITHKGAYRDDAIAMTKFSLARWLVNGKFADQGRFVHLLIESWTYLKFVTREKVVPWDEIAAGLAYLHERARSANGHYPKDWNGIAPASDAPIELLEQASFARACFVVAKAFK